MCFCFSADPDLSPPPRRDVNAADVMYEQLRFIIGGRKMPLWDFRRANGDACPCLLAESSGLWVVFSAPTRGSFITETQSGGEGRARNGKCEKHSKLERVAAHSSSEINIYLRTLTPFLSFDVSRPAPRQYRCVSPNVRHIQMSDCRYRIEKTKQKNIPIQMPFRSKLKSVTVNRSSVSSSYDRGAANAWLGNVEVLLLTLPVGPKHTQTTQKPLLTAPESLKEGWPRRGLQLGAAL